MTSHLKYLIYPTGNRFTWTIRDGRHTVNSTSSFRSTGRAINNMRNFIRKCKLAHTGKSDMNVEYVG